MGKQGGQCFTGFFGAHKGFADQEGVDAGVLHGFHIIAGHDAGFGHQQAVGRHVFVQIERGLDAVPANVWDLRLTEIDEQKFPCFRLAKEVGKSGGAYPSLLVGADESAVDSFLKGEINFTNIYQVVEKTLDSWNGTPPTSVDDAISLVDVGRRLAGEFCKNWRHNS